MSFEGPQRLPVVQGASSIRRSGLRTNERQTLFVLQTYLCFHLPSLRTLKKKKNSYFESLPLLYVQVATYIPALPSNCWSCSMCPMEGML